MISLEALVTPSGLKGIYIEQLHASGAMRGKQHGAILRLGDNKSQEQQDCQPTSAHLDLAQRAQPHERRGEIKQGGPHIPRADVTSAMPQPPTDLQEIAVGTGVSPIPPE